MKVYKKKTYSIAMRLYAALLLACMLGGCSFIPHNKTIVLGDRAAPTPAQSGSPLSPEVARIVAVDLSRLGENIDFPHCDLVLGWVDNERLLAMKQDSIEKEDLKGGSIFDVNKTLIAMDYRYGFMDGYYTTLNTLVAAYKKGNLIITTEIVDGLEVPYFYRNLKQGESSDPVLVFDDLSPEWDIGLSSDGQYFIRILKNYMEIYDTHSGSLIYSNDNLDISLDLSEKRIILEKNDAAFLDEQGLSWVDFLNSIIDLRNNILLGNFLLEYRASADLALFYMDTYNYKTIARDVEETRFLGSNYVLLRTSDALSIYNMLSGTMQSTHNSIVSYTLSDDERYIALFRETQQGLCDVIVGEIFDGDIVRSRVVYKGLSPCAGQCSFSPDNTRLYLEGHNRSDQHVGVVLEFQ